MNREFIDFKALRERVPFDCVLERYGIRLRDVGNGQLRGKCPLPSHSSKESRDSFFVNVKKQVWCCHSDSCKSASGKEGGNVLDFVAAKEGVSIRQAAELLHGWYPATGDGEPYSRGETDRQQEKQKAPREAERDATRLPVNDSQSPGTNKPLGFRLKDVNPRHEMIQAKGISVETAKGFGIGHFPGKGTMANRIVFELHEKGELIGYAGRLVSGDGPKWMLPKNLVKSFVYGLERCDPRHPLILGESFWLPAYMHERELWAASLMGSEMTESQEAALAPFKLIWLSFDNDEAGRKKAAPIRERLVRNHAVRMCFLRE
jgi:DNA primase